MNTTSSKKKESVPVDAEDMVTFKRSHFYAVLVGYVAWGGTPVPTQTVSNDQPAAQAPVAQAPVATQPPQYTRYDIPTDGFPSIGPEDAPIVIVEFSDFQCPFCKRFFDETYKPLLAAYPDKIRFVYRNLPLTSIHAEAFPAAEAAMCANDQNSFWQYHDKIFERQAELGQPAYLQFATDLGLDLSAFQECLGSNRYNEFIQKDMDFAATLGVQSTPTFFINGLALVGAQPLSAFTQLIDKELAGEIPK